ncbi:heavy metal-associated isoprenylated plant protein 8 [Cryptomeria japonica]|uniref:heavy metal-associated isoprenylated plant protein 8 n=1 Tax=Cryptomeria japonica TaxID=3369 RepID=UPI0027DA3043|nr:heavy metal-associated isoprenylated plant protein 8 [Cryptomeria japonica]
MNECLLRCPFYLFPLILSVVGHSTGQTCLFAFTNTESKLLKTPTSPFARKESSLSLYVPHHNPEHIQYRTKYRSIFYSFKGFILVNHNIEALSRSSQMPTIELRVGMHCDKCIKEIKRAIRRLEGIETYRMDTVQQKMTVTGEVTAKQVIKTLVKSGKPACNWDAYPAH